MKLRSWQIIIMVAMGAVLISACQSAPAPTLSTTEQPSSETIQEEQAYPEPEGYPAPVQSSGYIPYPSPGEGEQIDWAQAEEMIMNGEVSAVFQSLSNQVTIYLRNNQQVVTTQPEPDDVIRVIEECGSPCKMIRIGKE